MRSERCSSMTSGTRLTPPVRKRRVTGQTGADTKVAVPAARHSRTRLGENPRHGCASPPRARERGDLSTKQVGPGLETRPCCFPCACPASGFRRYSWQLEHLLYGH